MESKDGGREREQMSKRKRLLQWVLEIGVLSGVGMAIMHIVLENMTAAVFLLLFSILMKLESIDLRNE